MALRSDGLQEASLGSPSFDSSTRHFVLALCDDNVALATNEGEDLVSLGDVANLRAPECIHTIQLVAVFITLFFRAATVEVAGIDAGASMGDLLTQTTDLIIQRDELQRDQGPLGYQDFESLLENDYLGRGVLTDTLIDAKCPESVRRKTTMTKRRTSEATIVSLTDIAMRSLICQKPMRTSTGLMSYGNSSLFHLANLAPAVFVPGYREAVQGRAKLIPTIVRFLSQFLQQSGRQAYPEKRTERSFTSLSGLSKENNDTEQKETLKGHLWMTLANGVKNIEAARKLRPLHVPQAGGTEHSSSRTFEDLLDPWNASEEDDIVFFLEDQFEDLHFNEDEDFPKSEKDYFSDLYDEVLSNFSTELGNTTKFAPYHVNNGYAVELSRSPLDDGALSETLSSAYSTSRPVPFSLLEYAVTEDLTGNSLSPRASRDLRAELDSSDSQLNELAQICISTRQCSDVIGRNACSHAYVSRMHPKYISNDRDSYMHLDNLRVLEQFYRHDRNLDASIPLLYEPSRSGGDQDIIGPEGDQYAVGIDNFDYDIEMPAYSKTNGSSLADVIGGEHLLWQMWTKRRPSMIQSEEDMLEMHAMYARDPDMRLLESRKTTRDENGDEYMLDSEGLNVSSVNSASSVTGDEAFMFPYGPYPTGEGRHRHSFHSPKETPPASSQNGTSRPPSTRKLSRRQSFFKRLSGERPSVEEASTSSRPFSRGEPRDIEIKRRKTLADYENSSGNDEMLLN